MLANSTDYVRPGDHRLETPGAAAPAFQSSGLDLEMAELTPEPERAPLQLTTQDQAAADARTQGDVEHILEAACSACAPLAVSTSIGVVLKDYGQADFSNELCVQIDRGQIKHVGRDFKPVLPVINKAGPSDSHRGDLTSTVQSARERSYHVNNLLDECLRISDLGYNMSPVQYRRVSTDNGPPYHPADIQTDIQSAIITRGHGLAWVG